MPQPNNRIQLDGINDYFCFFQSLLEQFLHFRISFLIMKRQCETRPAHACIESSFAPKIFLACEHRRSHQCMFTKIKASATPPADHAHLIKQFTRC